MMDCTSPPSPYRIYRAANQTFTLEKVVIGTRRPVLRMCGFWHYLAAEAWVRLLRRQDDDMPDKR